jgi:hypothetical protein
MRPRPELSEADVDALHAAVLRAGENMMAARRLLSERGPDPVLLGVVLRRAVPRVFLEALAVMPPWSRDGRVLAAVVLSPQAPPRICVPVLPALHWHDLAEVARTLRVAPPVRARAETLLLERLPDLRLGERISLGRMATPPVLRELLRHAEPRVIEASLVNPRLREDDILSVMRANDVPVALLEAAAGSRRWSENYNVRLELVLQARTPLALALAQITSLVPRDLIRVSKTRGLRPLVHAAALRAAVGPEPPNGGSGAQPQSGVGPRGPERRDSFPREPPKAKSRGIRKID